MRAGRVEDAIDLTPELDLEAEYYTANQFLNEAMASCFAKQETGWRVLFSSC